MSETVRTRFMALLLCSFLTQASMGADLYPDLVKAAGAGDVAKVRSLLDQGVDPNAASSGMGRSALAYAAFYKRAEVMEVLLAAGADPNARSKLGQTALHEVLNAPGPSRKLEMVKLLLAHGADVNAKDNIGMTPLALAKLDELEDVATLLQENGAH
jgi:ankyrin repeat protein